MNKKQVVKVTLSYSWQSKEKLEMYGIVIDDNRVLLENGNLCKLDSKKYGEDVQVSATRNVPAGIRTALEEAYPKFIEAEKIDNQIYALNERLRKLNDEIGKDLPAKTRAARGLLSRTEFIEEFENNLKPDVQQALHSGNYRLELYGKTLTIEREAYIEKWYRNENEICYQEYDGAMCIRDGARKTEIYQDMVKRYSKPLPVKGCKMKEGLYFGDKSTLMYSGIYEIPVESSLTKEYAKKLAEMFCNGEKTRAKKQYERC